MLPLSCDADLCRDPNERHEVLTSCCSTWTTHPEYVICRRCHKPGCQDCASPCFECGDILHARCLVQKAFRYLTEPPQVETICPHCAEEVEYEIQWDVMDAVWRA